MGIKENIVQEIQEQQLRWYGHVKRRTEKLLNRLQNGSHRGKGSEVDQSTTWKDGIRESMKRRELKGEECMDRDLWRRKIMSLG
jgi:hypothetical protein